MIHSHTELSMDVNEERVLSLIRRPKWARHLMLHERRKRVLNTGGAYYYKDRENGKLRVLSGLCPRLHKTFWSHSSFYTVSKQTKKQNQGVSKKKTTKNRGRFGGLVRGSRVHKELMNFVLLPPAAFKKLHRQKLHHCTTQILKAIVDKLKLQPFLPEFDIGDEHINVGTSIDMVCVDSDGRIVLLEFKTGYTDSFLTQDGQMERSLHLMPCSPQNQATIQLVAAALILHKRYDVPLEEMRLYVLRCDESVVDIVPVQLTFLQILGDSIYSDLHNAAHSTEEGG
jgi:hypothetical protein